MRWTPFSGLLPIFSANTTVVLFAVVVFSGTAPAGAEQMILVVNPYEGIAWAEIQQYKGNLHTHTTQSDGQFEPARVMDMYRDHGYSILALTDHNKCTWPWEKFERLPGNLGMTALPGNELSRHHHTLSLFCEYETEAEDLDAAIAGVADAGGVAILCHPAMHWEPEYSDASRLRRFLDASVRPGEIPAEVLEKYIALFTRYPHLVATEISNASEPLYRYPLDRMLWDRLLGELMPDRPIWGVNTDDMHSKDHFGSDYVMFLSASREAQAIREALVQGAFYFATRRVPETGPQSNADPPSITSINHDKAAHTLEVHSSVDGISLPDSAYAWISGGEVIHTGPQLAYHAVSMPAPYVRVEIVAEGGTTFTNPFGFRKQT